MTSAVLSTLVTGLTPLLGAALGASATLLVQRNSARHSEREFLAERQLAHREELKSAILTYLEAAQRLQTEFDIRERGGAPADPRRLIEDVWLAEKRVELICPDELRDRVLAHASALQDIVRDPGAYPDWWAYCAPAQHELLAQAKRSLIRDQGW
ncbi:hypothetical protein ABZV91_14715 [Nocardia sp. NPDC004568]|uniref:hypothetical protein n=1 Tax=Nocardia sp. NPDC004568 TaxID=3154551 RepID=UPI00339F81ED